jgi:hypothetical protein
MGYMDIDDVKRRYGAEAAKEFSLFLKAHVYAMKNVVEKEKLDCDFILTRRIEAFLHQAHASKLKEVYEDQLKEGLDYIEDVDFVNQKYIERVSLLHSIVSLMSYFDNPGLYSLLLQLKQSTALWN